MTPKEKAKELFDKMHIDLNEFEVYYPTYSSRQAKECALIAVDEIKKAIDFDWMEVQNLESEHRFWDEVKNEIENLKWESK